MKKLIFTSILCALVLTSCGSGSTDSSSKNESPADTTSVTSTASVESIESSSEETTAATVGEGDIGEFYIKIGDASPATDENGNSAISITFDLTNNGTTPLSSSTAIQTLVYQDDEGISEVIVDKTETVKAATMIKPGETLQMTLSYKLKNETSPVEVKCRGGSDNESTNEVVSQTFTLPLE